jgi:subtilisin family serine protease
VTSEGASTIHAPEFHARTGATGAGVSVGILDASFAKAKDLVGEELPEGAQATDRVRERLDSYEDVHGTACAEIVHDVAPEANLILAGFEDEVTWAQAIDELVGGGARIISHSIGFDNLFPLDGANYFSQKVDQAAAAGVLFVTAAGNEAGNYYQGTWTDADSDLFLEFRPTGAELLPVFAGAPGSRAVLRWDEPFGAATHDYDLLVVTADFASNPTLSRDNPAILAASADLQSETRNPREVLEFEVPSDQIVYLVVVRDPASPANPAQRFWLHAAGGVEPTFMNAAGSLSLPADARGALTVGAAPFSSPVTVEGYSSRGPTFDGRMKPEIAGPDAVATASYAGQPFSGTSAATPHVAGAAALALSRNPTLSVSGLRSLLEQATQSGGRLGNNDLGFGTIDLNLLR